MKPLFVEFIPEKLENEIIYISLIYSTCIHLCACGCGNQVVTPIYEDWILIRNKDLVSLSPSIKNNFPCKSHYFIKDNEIIWC